VQDDAFVDLLDMGLRMQSYRDTNQKPWVEGHTSLEDFLKANRYLTLVMAKEEQGPGGQTLTDRHLFFKDEVLRELRRVLKTLVREDNIFVSDRKIIKMYRLLRTRAWILHGGTVEREDLRLLSYLGETMDAIDLLETKVPTLLGLTTEARPAAGS